VSIPAIPIPAPIRSWLLRKAIWDYLRTRLSFDEATSVKGQAEAAVAATLEDIIQGAKR